MTGKTINLSLQAMAAAMTPCCCRRSYKSTGR